MKDQSPLVSIIIPVYNGSGFISETIQSILNQQYDNIEVIIIDDGSTDNLSDIIQPFLNQHKHIQFISKENTGVSHSRNLGFEKSNGTYVVFLDADDILAEKFISQKVSLIQDHQFVGSVIHYFSSDINNPFKETISIVSEVVNKVLFYDPNEVSCPSAYLFNSAFLRQYSIRFNEKLSSIADREFLLQLARYNAKGVLDKRNNSALFYRIHDNNMSGKLTLKLINDNALFYMFLSKEDWLSPDIKKKALKKGYNILFKSFFKIRQYGQSLSYFFKYISI